MTEAVTYTTRLFLLRQPSTMITVFVSQRMYLFLFWKDPAYEDALFSVIWRVFSKL